MNFKQEKVDWKSFPFELLSAISVTAPRNLPPIVRHDYEVLTVEYVSSGEGFLDINGQSFQLKSDSIYFLTPHSSHSYRPNRRDPWKKIFFSVSGALSEKLLQAYHLEQIYCIPSCPELKKYFVEMTQLTCGQVEANLHGAVIFHAFLAQAAELVFRDDRAGANAQSLHRALEKAVEGRFSLGEYAKKHDISTSALIRSFRQSFGVTPHEYLLQCKFETARRLLLYSDLSIKEIADKLAFADQYHFSNAFKKWSAMSPSELRKNPRD